MQPENKMPRTLKVLLKKLFKEGDKMLRILIQDEKDKQKWSYLKVKREDTETKTEEVEDPDTHEIKTVTTEVGLGTYSSVIYEESNPAEFEKRCIELLKTYNRSQLDFVDRKEYGIDLLWDLDKDYRRLVSTFPQGKR